MQKKVKYEFHVGKEKSLTKCGIPAALICYLIADVFSSYLII
jgi:hypothetical protein